MQYSPSIISKLRVALTSLICVFSFIFFLGNTVNAQTSSPTPPEECTDTDGDGFCDVEDNCISTPNQDQADTDEDGIGNSCDNCPTMANADQADTDQDGIGDVCDNCQDVSNQDQADADQDEIGDLCEESNVRVCKFNDKDKDGIWDEQEVGIANWDLIVTQTGGSVRSVEDIDTTTTIDLTTGKDGCVETYVAPWYNYKVEEIN